MPEPVSDADDRDVRDLARRGFRYALALCHEPSAAEDLLQEGWMRLLRAGSPVEPGPLFVTIRRIFIDERRRSSVAPFALWDESVVERIAGVDPGNETVLATSAQIEAALGGLRPDEREAVYLQCVEGHTAAEIAKLTGRTRGTVLSLIFRAKQKLSAMCHGEPREAAQ
ncbi:MAG: RNA polymerase sigma factor [Deltaproteobacteria bacterium]|nr:RNA polymerase sigma factor [Deltaproteobacteria bacterium]